MSSARTQLSSDRSRVLRMTQSQEVVRGIIAGLAGALAFLLAMTLDLFLTRRRTNDLRLLAGMLPGGAPHWPVLGTAMHFFNGAALGALYALLHERLPGSPAVRGIIFALLENALLWPVLLLLDRIHPEIRAGRLEPFNRPIPFLQEVWRHVAYGLTLGRVHFWLSERGVQASSLSARFEHKREFPGPRR